MTFFQVAGVVLFIIALVVSAFLFGIYVANAYHKQAREESRSSVVQYQETMREGMALNRGHEYLMSRVSPYLEQENVSFYRRNNA